MQFYIFNKSPKINALELPDYAIKKVNVREGWQILSDIAFRFNICFNGQNKHYNQYHPLTRSFSNKIDFMEFVNNYRACVFEYLRRYGKHHECGQKFVDMGIDDVISAIKIKLPADKYEEVKHYLFTAKLKHIKKETTNEN